MLLNIITLILKKKCDIQVDGFTNTIPAKILPSWPSSIMGHDQNLTDGLTDGKIDR